MKTCVLCGVKAVQHPWVGVGRQNLETNAGPMTKYDVCFHCHRFPKNRTLKNVKLHFHPAPQGDIAVAGANRLLELSKNGGDLSL